MKKFLDNSNVQLFFLAYVFIISIEGSIDAFHAFIAIINIGYIEITWCNLVGLLNALMNLFALAIIAVILIVAFREVFEEVESDKVDSK